MKLYRGFRKIILCAERNGCTVNEKTVLRNLDDTFSTEKDFENSYFEVYIERITIDGDDIYICYPSGRNSCERFEIKFKDFLLRRPAPIEESPNEVEILHGHTPIDGDEFYVSIKKILEYLEENFNSGRLRDSILYHEIKRYFERCPRRV